MRFITKTQIRYIIPSATNCFFHVYEEPIGRHGFSILKHVLKNRGGVYGADLKTGCNRVDIDKHHFVEISNDIVIDRSWCRTCAGEIEQEIKRGHSPSQAVKLVEFPVSWQSIFNAIV